MNTNSDERLGREGIHPVLRTRLAEQLGLTVPIVSSGMAFIAGPELAAAVSNAGGLGTLGVGMEPPRRFRAQVEEIRRRTARPFAVDLIVDHVTEEHVEVCISERVPVVVFFWRLPPRAWVDRLQAGGCRAWMQVGSVAEAREALEIGADAIVVQGAEAGGHNRSEASIFALLPAVVREAGCTPVLAAGGIVDGRGLLAALVLGAEAVWCGTRFLAAEEANAHPGYQVRVTEAKVGDTVRTTLFGPEWPGQAMRVLRTPLVDEWAGREDEAMAAVSSTPPIGETEVAGQPYTMPFCSAALPTRKTQGEVQRFALTMGEAAGNIRSIESADAILFAMAREAIEAAGSRLAGV
jgi:NAD(P)H-dependent flavin oxidoreductase YrpB (nitropropane dioxygenase family)